MLFGNISETLVVQAECHEGDEGFFVVGQEVSVGQGEADDGEGGHPEPDQGYSKVKGTKALFGSVHFLDI